MPRLGLVTGMQFEADIVRKAVGENANFAIACEGPGPEAAARAAAAVVDQGASALISFGITGGLEPGLRTGDVLVPIYVQDSTSKIGTDAELSNKMRGSTQAIDLSIISTNDAIASVVDKAALRRSSGAGAVDMESYAIAMVAQKFALPFTVLRVVADEAGQALPPSALAGGRPDGTVAVGAVIASLMKRPGDLPDLIRLGRQTSIARKKLGDLAFRVLPLLV